MRRRHALVSILLAATLGHGAVAQEALSPETRAQLDRSCATCHGTDLIAQQRLTGTQWRKVVDKMIGWGAALPPDAAAPLAAGLASAYGEDTPAYRPSTITGEAALAAIGPRPDPALDGGDPAAGSALYGQVCAACHGPKALGQIGVALADKPVLDQPERFARVVHAGLRSMPPMPHLESAQLADLLAYLRDLPGP